MSIARRAMLSVVRHSTRSLLFSALFALVFTILIAYMGIRAALVSSSASVGNFPHTGVLLHATNDRLSPDSLDEAAKVTGNQCVPASLTTASAAGITPLRSENGPILNSDVASHVGVLGVSDIAYLPAFVDSLRLTSSSAHVSPLSAGSLYMHEDLARAHNLTVGSHVTLTREGTSVTVRLAGFFTGSHNATFLIPSDRPDNTLVVDSQSAATLAGTEEPSKAFCPMPQGADVGAAVEKIHRSVGDGIEVSDVSSAHIRAVKALGAVTTLLNVLFACVIILGIGVLSFTFILQVRGRVHEIGILMALGESRKSISLQLFIENVILALLGAPCAIFAGDWATHQLATTVAARLGPPSADFLAGATSSSSSILVALAVGVGVVVVALLVASIPLARRSTREILTAAS